MKYAQITLSVAYEDYGSKDLEASDYVLPTLHDEGPPELIVLESEERPMFLFVDFSAGKIDK
jgi:hypothetical protein